MTCGGSTCPCSAPGVEIGFIDGDVRIKKYSVGNWVNTTNKCTSGWKNEVDTWMNDLRFFGNNYGNSNFDTVTWVGSAGMYTAKDGCHGKGRAFDLEYVKWNGANLNIYAGGSGPYPWQASASRTTRRLYLAVDASPRKYFKYVLDGWYGNIAGGSAASHKFHIHMENHSTPVLDRTNISSAAFVQAVCNNFNFAGLTIDGNWGPLTENAFDDINAAWSYSTTACNPFTNVSNYRDWLNLVIKHGFADQAAGHFTSTTC